MDSVNSSPRPSLFVALLGLALLAVSPGCASLVRATADRTKTVTHVDGSDLVVETRNGGVRVVVDPARGGAEIAAHVTARAETRPEAEARLDEIEVHATRRDDGALFVHVVYPDDEPRGGEGCALVITLGVVGDVRVRTSNGEVSVDGANGALDVRTSNGAIDVVGGAEATLATSNGNVGARLVPGPVDVTTSNGGVALADVGGRTKVRTSNGRIRLESRGDHRSVFDLKTSNGDVDVFLPGQPSARVDVRTSNGGIVVDGADEVEGSKRRKTVRFGGGEPACEVTTSNGDVRLVRTGA